MRRTVFATVALALFLPLAAQAQEWPPQPTKYTNVAWYTIVNFDLAGPNAEAATDVFMDVFVPAFAASGNPIRAFEHSTGEWDITLIFPMESPSDLEWDMAPEFVAALVAMAEAVGGERLGELGELVEGAMVRQNVTIVRERKGGM